jgi:hypothetical protein
MHTTLTGRPVRDAKSAEEGIVILFRKHWPTPNTPTGGGNLTSTPKHTGGIDLEGEAELWQTPATDSFRSRGGDRKDEMGLDQQARFAMFPTPAARDYRSESGGAATMNHFNRPAGPSLPAMIEHSFLPDQPTESDGQPLSESAQTSPRRLNPKFVEWLQGLPEGWTSAASISSAVWGTWLSRCRERLRSLCCEEGRE